MDNVITLSFGRTYTDGGKSRIRARRQVMGLSPIAEAQQSIDACELIMQRADPEQPYEAPPHDAA